MNYQTFEVFGGQHLITLFICAALILSYIKYFQNQTESKKVLGGKIVAIIIIIHMLTQPIYDVLLFDLPWQGEFPLHMCDFSMLAMIVYLLKDNAPKILFNCAYFWGICGASMALATPDLEYGFPHGEYSPFFLGSQFYIACGPLCGHGVQRKTISHRHPQSNRSYIGIINSCLCCQSLDRLPCKLLVLG